MLRSLAFVLVHWPYTFSLAGLANALEDELDLREIMAAHGSASPNQFPPSFPYLLLVLLVAAVTFAVALARL